jgi:hypothetical protein
MGQKSATDSTRFSWKGFTDHPKWRAPNFMERRNRDKNTKAEVGYHHIPDKTRSIVVKVKVKLQGRK